MKISIEYDTVTKIGSIMMGDKKIDDVSSVNLYGWGQEDKFGLEVRTVEGDEENKITKTTCVYASEGGYKITETDDRKELIASIGKLLLN